MGENNKSNKQWHVTGALPAKLFADLRSLFQSLYKVSYKTLDWESESIMSNHNGLCWVWEHGHTQNTDLQKKSLKEAKDIFC